jgi:hypothetical protein
VFGSILYLRLQTRETFKRKLIKREKEQMIAPFDY